MPQWQPRRSQVAYLSSSGWFRRPIRDRPQVSSGMPRRHMLATSLGLVSGRPLPTESVYRLDLPLQSRRLTPMTRERRPSLALTGERRQMYACSSGLILHLQSASFEISADNADEYTNIRSTIAKPARGSLTMKSQFYRREVTVVRQSSRAPQRHLFNACEI